MTVEILGLIFLALAFDFLNGFHDSANSIATVVSTRVLSPRVAVFWAAFFNFIAFLFFGSRQRFSAVRWGVAGTIVWAWVLTIPCSAALSAIACFLAR